MTKALITGSYDPITVGHMDIIARCSKMFDEVIVLISKNSEKNYMLCSNSRAALAEDAVKSFGNVSVDIYDGMIAEYAVNKNITTVVKGLRNEKDYIYENEMALVNMRLAKTIFGGDCETLYMPCKPEFSDVSSTLVRILIKQGKDFSSLVPNAELLKQKLM